jgi:hypothetical protein
LSRGGLRNTTRGCPVTGWNVIGSGAAFIGEQLRRRLPGRGPPGRRTILHVDEVPTASPTRPFAAGYAFLFVA